MNGNGLAGAMGGVNLKAQRAGTYDILLPLPQHVDSQIPVFYRSNTIPQAALKACRIQSRDGENVCISLQLEVSKGQQVTVEWSSVVLIAQQALKPLCSG